MGLKKKLKEFYEGYVSGLSVIEVHLKARRLNVENLEDIENYSWLEDLKEDYEDAGFMYHFCVQEDSGLRELGLSSSFLLNPIKTFRGPFYYRRKED